eukprot:TRINITY_DN31216_c0_g1_i1.p1 TRINITY_DN31216_c0_g1~~TRINITY_DN31216_c0_g1_i1.p1  ORF type:complete len:211 (-),score=49.07 TRINITY_DN31216_c0_g1_i1:329-892(-)
MGGSSSALAPLKAMETPMSLDKFMGTWYVIANIPTPFEKGAHNAVEVYSTPEAGSSYDIDVSFKFNKGSFAGSVSEMRQKGWVKNKETFAEWRVSPIVAGFTIPYKAPYIICDITEGKSQYETTIVGYPDRSYLWVMARQPQISDDTFQSQMAKVKEMGYDLEKVQKVPQQTPEERAAKAAPPAPEL